MQPDDEKLSHGPIQILEPLRSDALKLHQKKPKKLDRLAAEILPEIHFVGQISSAVGLREESSEGVCVR